SGSSTRRSAPTYRTVDDRPRTDTVRSLRGILVKRELLQAYVCPLARSPLSAEPAGPGELETGTLLSKAGHRYAVAQGVPDFVPSGSLTQEEHATQVEYDASADQKYDAAVDWLFRSFYENE